MARVTVPIDKSKCLDQTISSRTPTTIGHAPRVEYDGFWDVTMKATGFTNKEAAYDLHVSESLYKMWRSGERFDPFFRSRLAVEMLRCRGRADLIPSVLIYIAGGYDGLVLTREQFEALKILLGAVKVNP